LKKDFPSAKLSVVVGPKAESLFIGNPYLNKVYIFDKHQPPLRSLSWIRELRKERFDLVVDLRNTAIPLMLSPRYRTSYRLKKVPKLHMREKHLNRLRSVYVPESQTAEKCALFVASKEEEYVDQLIEKEIGRDGRFVIIAPGAADRSKRWPEDNFSSLCDRLIKEHKLKIIFVGNEEDRNVIQRIIKSMNGGAVDLCGRTNLVQLAGLFKRCFFTIVNDSAPMHMASYLDISVLALFGPTDPAQYGPWSMKSCFLKKSGACDACINSKKTPEHSCMSAVTEADVYDSLKINTSENRIEFKNDT
jgi:ADP-heptose:LPS heptosyltransferase